MKIGMVLWSSFPPDIRVKRQARFLVENGHEVQIICRGKPNQSTHETIDGIEVHRHYITPAVLRFMDWRIRNLTLISPTWYKKIRQMVSNESYDIIHVHDLPPLRTVLLSTKGLDVPVVADFHELYPEALKIWRQNESIAQRVRPGRFLTPSWRYKRLEQGLIENGISGLVTVSPEQLEYYREDHDLSGIETGVVRNVPDLDRLRQMPIESLEYDGYVVGYVGNFSPQRALETAIESFANLLESVPDATLLMVGDSNGDYVDDLRQMCADLGIKDNVEFTGWVDFERVPSYMNACDVTLCTWVGNNIDSECTLPNKLFQSMFMETPVVVSDLRAMRNVVKETNCGLVTEQDSVSSLTEALLKLHENPELRREMGENGKRAVEEKYNFDNEINNLINIYKNCNNIASSN